MDENIQTIKIDEDGKYIIIIDGISDMEFLQRVSSILKDWWNSNEKFLVFAPYDGTKIRLERLEKNG